MSRWMMGLAAAALVSPASAREGWELVSAYDVSAVEALKLLAGADPADIEADTYVWVESGGMQHSCGNGKTPDGMGLFEAEAMANGQLPVLALVLQNHSGGRAISPHDVKVSLGRTEPEVFLQPALVPRSLAIDVSGSAPERYRQLVADQFQRYLCIEHKTGRAWQGGTREEVEQALLIRPPTPDPDATDRKFFGGQLSPVAPLLGPPDACLVKTPGLSNGPGGDRSGRGETSLQLVPADALGASLRWCRPNHEKGGHYYDGPRTVPMQLSETPEEHVDHAGRMWSKLEITVDGTPEFNEDGTGDGVYALTVEAKLSTGETSKDAEGRDVLPMDTIIARKPLYSRPDDPNGDPLLEDLVARVPYEYPTIGVEGDQDRYTVLLIPNWQVVEAVRRLHTDRITAGMDDGGLGIQDGVGWILNHPEFLFVQVPQENAAPDADWLNVAAPMAGGEAGLRSWGYPTGMLAGRAPIVALSNNEPTWQEAKTAQRATMQGFFLGGAGILAVFMLGGIGRVRELWTTVPEERVDFWPGPPVDGDDEDDPAMLEGDE